MSVLYATSGSHVHLSSHYEMQTPDHTNLHPPKRMSAPVCLLRPADNQWRISGFLEPEFNPQTCGELPGQLWPLSRPSSFLWWLFYTLTRSPPASLSRACSGISQTRSRTFPPAVHS